MTATRTSAGPSDGRTSLSIAIGGMTCGACAARIERRLNAVDGVEARVSYASERARVELPAGADAAGLVDQIEAIGFTAQVVEDGVEWADQTEAAERTVRSLRRRLIVSVVLFMPLCDASLAFWLLPQLRFPGWQWLLLLVAVPVVTWAAWPFYRAALRNARHGTTSMDTLVSIGIVAATAWSLYAMFWLDNGTAPITSLHHLPGGAIYLDVAGGVVTFLLAGRYYEARWRLRSGSALRSLVAVGAKDVAVLDAAGAERRIPVSLLQVGDRFVVRPGETVAADGDVETGRSSLDRSAMTGESLPVEAGPGDPVVGGTVSVDGRLVVRATSVGRDTQLAHMVRLVEDAQSQKASVQRLADRIAAVFVPAVVVIAVVTLVGWLASGASTQHALSAAISVLIIACPCALGLATPTALLVASGQGARLGIFFKGYEALEVSRRIDMVLMDKTGTVTEGSMSVVDLTSSPDVDRDDVLRWAGAVEFASGHPIARAVTDAALDRVGSLPDVEAFSVCAGLGAQGTVEGHAITVGREEVHVDPDRGATIPAIVPASVAGRCAEWEEAGHTTVLVGRDGVVVGALALTDRPRPSAAAAVAALRDLGLHCVLVTGDSASTARAVGRAVGIDDVVAGALPSGKVDLIRRLQVEGHSVAMIGDGVNDGPALASANLGLAVGSGTDVAINAADLIIVRDDLRVAATAIDLSRRTLRTIHSNLVWAFAYNVAAIPLAAFGLLNPLIAGAAMAMSSAFVVLNSSRLRTYAASAAPAPLAPESGRRSATAEPAPPRGLDPTAVQGAPVGAGPVLIDS